MKLTYSQLLDLADEKATEAVCECVDRIIKTLESPEDLYDPDISLLLHEKYWEVYKDTFNEVVNDYFNKED